MRKLLWRLGEKELLTDTALVSRDFLREMLMQMRRIFWVPKKVKSSAQSIHVTKEGESVLEGNGKGPEGLYCGGCIWC